MSLQITIYPTYKISAMPYFLHSECSSYWTKYSAVVFSKCVCNVWVYRNNKSISVTSNITAVKIFIMSTLGSSGTSTDLKEKQFNHLLSSISCWLLSRFRKKFLQSTKINSTMHRPDNKHQFRTGDKMRGFSANIKLTNMNKLFRSEN